MMFNAMLIDDMYDIYAYMRVCLKNCYPQKQLKMFDSSWIQQNFILTAQVISTTIMAERVFF